LAVITPVYLIISKITPAQLEDWLIVANIQIKIKITKANFFPIVSSLGQLRFIDQEDGKNVS
jgi:hypothetical protein